MLCVNKNGKKVDQVIAFSREYETMEQKDDRIKENHILPNEKD